MFNELIDFNKAKFDENGILIANTELDLNGNVRINQQVKERADDYEQLKRNLPNKLEDFTRNKQADHLEYIGKAGTFNDKTIYLEIGCWPSGVGEYIMVNFNSYFIGVDFNYGRLKILKESFEKKGYKKYMLVMSDINAMPIKDNTVDFVYGGGVIEHLKSTERIIDEIYRILKPSGVSYNTIPAFNLWWLTRFNNTVPNVPVLRDIFQFIHTRILHGRALKNHWGYQWAFTRGSLKRLHRNAGFKDITVGPFAFHPSDSKMKSKFLRNLVYTLRCWSLTTAIYFVYGKK